MFFKRKEVDISKIKPGDVITIREAIALEFAGIDASEYSVKHEREPWYNRIFFGDI